MAGDISLALDRVRFFIFGLIFFLIAHIFYIVYFKIDFKNIFKHKVKFSVLVLYTVGLGIALRGVPLKLMGPVYIYLTVIFVMLTSCLSSVKYSKMTFVGCTIFMFSDSVIAIDKFINKVPHSIFLILSTYYVAQFLIIRGAVMKKDAIIVDNG